MGRACVTAIPLSVRSTGERCMVESDDTDERGRHLWWLSTVEVRASDPVGTEAAREVYAEYRTLREQELLSAIDPATGIPSLLTPPSPKALRLRELAGDYAVGWDAADDALVAAADSGAVCALVDAKVPTIEHKALYWAGWADRMTEYAGARS
jgi:hypothetical protein